MLHQASSISFAGINPILNTQTKHSLRLAHVVDDKDIVLSIQCRLLVEYTQEGNFK